MFKETYKYWTVRDFCKSSLENYKQIKEYFEYAWYVEDYRSIKASPFVVITVDNIFASFLDYTLVVPEDWDGLSDSVARATVADFFEIENFFLP